MVNPFTAFGIAPAAALAYLGVRIMGEAYEIFFQKRVRNFFINHVHKNLTETKNGILDNIKRR